MRVSQLSFGVDDWKTAWEYQLKGELERLKGLFNSDIVARLGGEFEYDVVRTMSEAVASVVANRLPPTEEHCEMMKKRPYQFLVLSEALEIASHLNLEQKANVDVFLRLLKLANDPSSLVRHVPGQFCVYIGSFDWGAEVERGNVGILVPRFITAIVKSYAEHYSSEDYSIAAAS